MAPESIDRLLDEIAAAIGPAIDADPLNGLDRSFSVEIATLREWIHARVDFLKKHIQSRAIEPLVLNEIQALNTGEARDESGEAADWVEIYNRSAAEVSFEGLYLSDEAANPTRWPFPAGALPAGGRLLVWCDGDTGEGPFHAGFKLDQDGESVGLYQVRDGLVRALDFIRFGPREPGVSLGRFPDGAPGLRSLPCPTPGAENIAGCPPGARFTRGDATADGLLDLADVVALLDGLFLALPVNCWDALDVDDDGQASLTDAIRIILHLFLTGDPPSPPYPGCGFDVTPDSLGCATAGACG
jgi:hypothetical protein